MCLYICIYVCMCVFVLVYALCICAYLCVLYVCTVLEITVGHRLLYDRFQSKSILTGQIYSMRWQLINQ